MESVTFRQTFEGVCTFLTILIIWQAEKSNSKMFSQCYIYFLMDVNETRVWISEESWFDSWAGQEIFLISKAFRLALGPTLFPIQWVLRVLSLQWLGCEGDHWPLSNVEVKKRVKLCPASPCAFTDKLGQLFLFPDFTFTLLYFMDVNGQQLSRMLASTSHEKLKTENGLKARW